MSFISPGVYINQITTANSMPMPLSEFIPDDQFFDMRADGKISQKTMLRGLGFISMDEIDAIKDFVAESAGDAENRVAYAKDTGDKDEYNWWCGFAEALGEVMAKIDEISDGT